MGNYWTSNETSDTSADTGAKAADTGAKAADKTLPTESKTPMSVDVPSAVGQPATGATPAAEEPVVIKSPAPTDSRLLAVETATVGMPSV